MPSNSPLRRNITFSTLLYVTLLCAPLRAQETPPSAPQKPDEVIRVTSELIQTDVMVFDKEGRFIDNLRPEQFELKVDGKPRPVSFFERITAGSFDEDAQLAAARGGARRAAGAKSGAVQPLDRGRNVFFFIDDFHLAPGSLTQMRSLLLRFIDEEMRQNDSVQVASASGQIGFLQQLTDNKDVLRAAVARLKPIPYTVRDNEQPPMTEAQAFAIERNDLAVTDVFIEQTLRDLPPRTPRSVALSIVQNRARTLLQLGANVTTNTLSSLENQVRTLSPLSGRKLMFFVSDGFISDDRIGNVRDRLRRITDAASRARVVIYAVDAQGLGRGLPDSSTSAVFDPSGRLEQANSRIASTQDPLFTLAADTGGRTWTNSNKFNQRFAEALKETSVYYLLAWQPELAGERDTKFHRLEVSVKDRPELTVLVRRGFFNAPPAVENVEKNDKKRKSASPASTADTQLLSALQSAHPKSELPTWLWAGYFDAPPGGTMLALTVEIDSDTLSFQPSGDTQIAEADLVIAVFNEQGKPATSFKQHVSIKPNPAAKTIRRRAAFSHQLPLAPGLYQVRVATRDTKSGRTGSSTQWISIPDSKQKKFTMSSLLVGERTRETDTVKAASEAGTLQGVPISAGRMFANTSWLRFVTYVYNATGNVARPADVALQIQLFRDDQPVLTSPLRKLEIADPADTSSIPYAAELALQDFPAGLYVLQVTAIDRAAKETTMQRIRFTIE